MSSRERLLLDAQADRAVDPPLPIVGVCAEFATFTAYFASLLSPLNQISSLVRLSPPASLSGNAALTSPTAHPLTLQYRRVMSNAVDTEQLIELLNEKKEIQDKPHPVELVVGLEGADVSFRDVHFSYDGKVDVLRGISFDVPAGQSVALVGPSGGGKSTLSRLLFRMYDARTSSRSPLSLSWCREAFAELN